MTLAAGRRAPVLGASVATAVALAMLIGLGAWQLQRLRWKQGLIAQIDAAEVARPVELTGASPALFTRVVVHGALRPDRVALYGAEVRGMQMGAQLVQLLDRPGERPLVVVLGWVPTEGAPPRPLSGHADITGYVRLPETSTWLSAADDLQSRHFYALNPTTVGASLGSAGVAPFTLVALGPAKPAGQPQPADSLPRPVNNHLQYALTWFGLAASLLGVFASWVVKRRQA